MQLILALGALVALATGTFAQAPQCNQPSAFFSCSDASQACNSVTQNDISLSLGQTAKQIGGFGSAQVWLTRAASSTTEGNMNEVCFQIVAACCTGNTGSKSTAPLPGDDQTGSVQIIPS